MNNSHNLAHLQRRDILSLTQKMYSPPPQMISVSLGYFSLISLNIGVLRTTVFLEAESYNGFFFFQNQTLLTEIIILELQYNVAAFSVTTSKLYWQT